MFGSKLSINMINAKSKVSKVFNQICSKQKNNKQALQQTIQIEQTKRLFPNRFHTPAKKKKVIAIK